MPRKIRLLGVLFLSTLLLFVIAAASVAACGLAATPEKAEVAVVLGNEVKADGTPSARLTARLDRAVELYREGLFLDVVVSGGIGKSGYDEAVVMQDYLVAHGIPAASITPDNKGVNTLATARNVAEIMKARHMTSALVITQYFHVPRAKCALRKCGVSLVDAAYPRFLELRDLYSLAREVVALPVYWFRY